MRNFKEGNTDEVLDCLHLIAHNNNNKIKNHPKKPLRSYIISQWRERQGTTNHYQMWITTPRPPVTRGDQA